MANFRSLNSMIDKFCKIHGSTYSYELLTEYAPKTKIPVVCSIHGVFDITASAHLKGYGCIVCQTADQMSYDKLYKSKTQKFINAAKSIHGDRCDYSSTVVGYSEFVDIVCRKHGKFKQRIHDHLNGYNCLECGRTSCRQKLMYNTAEFIKLAKVAHGDTYNYDLVHYDGSYSKVEIICRTHGSFWQTPDNHINNLAGCPRCVSKWRLQNLWLDSIGIPDTPQHRQVKIETNGITDKRKQFVADGYDPTTRTVYEFLGDYHHGNPKLYQHDEIHCYTKQSLGQLFDNTLLKFSQLFNNQFVVIYIWENQFVRNQPFNTFDPAQPMVLV